MTKRFRVLRIIATIYKITAWIVLVLGLLFALGTLGVITLTGAGGGRDGFLPQLIAGGVLGIFGVLIGTLFYFLLFYGVGEAIYLALAIEENTRETTLLLREMRQMPVAPSQAPVLEPPPPAEPLPPA